MEIFYGIIVVAAIIVYSVYFFIKQQEQNEVNKADKEWIINTNKQDELSTGKADKYYWVYDEDGKRPVGICIYSNLSKMVIYRAKERLSETLNFDAIIDCKTNRKIIQGKSTTTAHTTSWNSGLNDPNETRTTYETHKEPDTAIFSINITTSNISSPLLVFRGNNKQVLELEAIIKIILNNRQS